MKSIVRQEAPEAGGRDGHLPTWILQEQKKKYQIIRHGRKSIIICPSRIQLFPAPLPSRNRDVQYPLSIYGHSELESSSSIMKRSPCTSFSSNICTICSTVILPFPLASFFRNCSSSFLCRSASRRLLAKLNILTASGSQPRRKEREKKSEDGLGQVSHFMPHGQLVLLSLGQSSSKKPTRPNWVDYRVKINLDF